MLDGFWGAARSLWHCNEQRWRGKEVSGAGRKLNGFLYFVRGGVLPCGNMVGQSVRRSFWLLFGKGGADMFDI